MLNVHPAYNHKSLTLILKVDESWSFVQAKKHPRWLWWVEDAVSGQVVAFVFGRRTHQTFRRLLSLLESAQVAVSKWITDAWWAYFDSLDQDLCIESKALLQSLSARPNAAHSHQTTSSEDNLFFKVGSGSRHSDWAIHRSVFLWRSTLLSHHLAVIIILQI